MADPYDPDRDDAQPGNATALEVSIAQTTGRLDDLDTDLPRRVGSSDIDEVPEPYLAHRAWSRSVDVYDPAWPVQIRRDVTEAAPEVHLHKGELFAVRRALAALRVDAEVRQWWETEPKGQPYTFEVRTFARARLYDGPLLDERMIRVVYAAIDRAKPLSRAFALNVSAGWIARVGVTTALVGKAKLSRAVVPRVETDMEAGLALVPALIGKATLSRAVVPRAETDMAGSLGIACTLVAKARLARAVVFALPE